MQGVRGAKRSSKLDYLPAPRLEPSVVPGSPSEISNPSPGESEAVWPLEADRPEFKCWSYPILTTWPWGAVECLRAIGSPVGLG